MARYSIPINRMTNDSKMADDIVSNMDTSVAQSQFGTKTGQQQMTTMNIKNDLEGIRDEFRALGLLSNIDSPRFQKEEDRGDSIFFDSNQQTKENPLNK